MFRKSKHSLRSRHAARVKNLGGHIVLGGDNVPPLVEIGLTDPPKSGGARAPLASHLVACLPVLFKDVKLSFSGFIDDIMKQL